MVSIQDARSQLDTQRSALQQRRTQLEQIRTLALTPGQLRGRTRAGLARGQLQARQIESAKQKELSKLGQFEKELGVFEGQVVKAEKQVRQQKANQAAFRKALDVFASDDPRGLFGLNKLEKDFFRKISAGKSTAIRKQFEKREIELKALQKTVTSAPVFAAGVGLGLKTTGFTGEFLKKLGGQAIDVLLPPQTDLERTKTQVAISDFGTQLQQGIGNLQTSTLKFISPSFKREQDLLNKENTQVQTRFDILNRDIEKFNNRFGGRELNPTQISQAQIQEKQLNTKINRFNQFF